MKNTNNVPFKNGKKAQDTSVLTGQVSSLSSQLAQNTAQITSVKKNFLNPQFIEYFGSFNRFGLGVPTGIANYTGGNYVLTVSGNAGDSFVTVQSGNIANAGLTARWACVIENNNGLFDVNQVTGTDGISRVNLLEPLKANITSKRLGNLHDADLGQHYTELGYFAFAQHIYNMKTRHVERNSYVAQFKPTDTSGSWVSGTNAFLMYNLSANMKDANKYFNKIGSSYFNMSANDNADYVEWEQILGGQKGYIESYIGVSRNTATIQFYKDGVLAETRQIGATADRVIFEYEGVQKGKIRIIANGPFNSDTQDIYIGLTTWWINGKFQYDKLINPSDKVIYIGDSWGVNQNQATTRELTRLMQADGGTPTVLNYSRGGHSSDYAKEGFIQYVVNNKPDKVIIEYFTNDFNSIGGTNLGTFTATDGTQKDMNIASLSEYTQNIQWMIDKAIENGIQPIIIMPASPNTDTQAQTFANNSVQIWLGLSTTNQNPTFKSVIIDTTTTSTVTSKDSSGVGIGTLPLVSKEINSASRKGIMSDTNTGAPITGGDIHGFYNNGTQKASVKFDGTFYGKQVQMIPITNYNDIPLNATGRGTIYYVDESVNYGGGDAYYVVIKDNTGAYVRKKLSLV
jgi:hypothetical protein